MKKEIYKDTLLAPCGTTLSPMAEHGVRGNWALSGQSAMTPPKFRLSGFLYFSGGVGQVASSYVATTNRTDDSSRFFKEAPPAAARTNDLVPRSLGKINACLSL